jgi:RimJ/RimL family protein N-acetyltransferase
MQEEDIEIVREWRNSDFVRLNMVNQEIITPESQIQWWNRIKALKTEWHFIILTKDLPVGVCNLKLHDTKSVIFGIYLAQKKFLKTGISIKAEFLTIEYAFNELNMDEIIVSVLEENQHIINMHKKFGFVFTKSSTYNSQNLIQLFLTKTQWSNYKYKIQKITDKI